MAMWVQHLLALSLVASCGGFTLWQGIKSFQGKQNRLGSCCSKGCGLAEKPKTPDAQKSTEQTYFMPVEMLARRKR